ncbi:MAG: efflux RND transporter periplasmic adaptor subunit [Planctomycetes bacterium]|nr:efflux RND transporter periplasmic adaptor subunit [Planctomycetota bacterium]
MPWTRTIYFSLALLLGVASGCKPAPEAKAKAEPPAKIAQVAQESELNTIKLTPEAEGRLGITLAPIARRPVQMLRPYGGEIALPTGASLIVSAPLGGTLQAAGSSFPKVGSRLKAGQPVLTLLPLLSPEREVLTPAERVRFAEARNIVRQSQIDAAGQVAQSTAQVEAAQIALERAQKLLKQDVGTARAVDDAQAQLNIAQKALDAARARKSQADSINLDEAPGKLAPLTITAPRDGIVRVEHVAPGEAVAPGAPLFEVLDTSRVWVRVSVYAGEVDALAPNQPAQISGLADRLVDKPLSAAPIAAPPTAVPLAAAVDLYFDLPNADGRFKPGERVTARLRLRGQDEQLTVPWSAVIYDIYGGTWVYEQTAPHTFVRRRVEVRQVQGDTAILERGPAVGAKIVTAGVVEMYGAEFGFAK